jgi:hypothetical protein
MLPKDYYAKVEGYNNKKRFEANLVRQHAFQIVGLYQSQGFNYNSFKNYFPLQWDELIEPVIMPKMTQEEIDELLKQVNEAEQKKVENG